MGTEPLERIAIRPATAGDEALILSFVRALADYERLLDEVEATAHSLGAALFGPHPRVFCDIAELEGEPAGFAIWFYNFSTFLAKHGIYLEDLYVLPQFRGHGVGKALLVHLAKRAMQEGCGRFEWWVLDWNEPSIAFYKSLGAQAMDNWTVFRVAGDALQRLANS
ncbi:MAG TPA: GNAT family N-acetyltransferase [Rhizomicrobium sp.]|nr:GNAT family N-acetyltransferase [Rhizomicrobium sp.]